MAVAEQRKANADEDQVELLVLRSETGDTKDANTLCTTEESKPQISIATFTFWFGALTTVSTVLTVANKYIMLHYPFSNTIVALQSIMSMTVLSVAGATGLAPMKPIKCHHAVIMLMASLFTCAQVVTNLQALPYVAIATVMVFRNFAIVATAITDRTVFGNVLSMNATLALCFVLTGSLIYTGGDVNYDKTGYFWLSINAVLYTGATIYNKIYQTKLQEKKEQTASGNALLGQSWMAVFGIGFMYAAGEPARGSLTKLRGLNSMCVALFLATGLAAPCIGVCYARCFAIAHATTVTVAATVNKCFAILVAAYAFNTQLSAVQYAGLLLTVLSGAWFAEEKKVKK
eukprot:g1928.t1